MSLKYDRVEVETLKWLKSNLVSKKTLSDFHEMVKWNFDGTVEELGVKYCMMEKEGLLLNGPYGTPVEITKEGLLALRGLPTSQQ